MLSMSFVLILIDESSVFILSLQGNKTIVEVVAVILFSVLPATVAYSTCKTANQLVIAMLGLALLVRRLLQLTSWFDVRSRTFRVHAFLAKAHAEAPQGHVLPLRIRRPRSVLLSCLFVTWIISIFPELLLEFCGLCF